GNSNYTTIPKHVLTPSGTIPASSYYLKLTSTALTGWSTKSGKLIKVSVATGEEEEGQGEEEVPSDGFDFVDDMTQGLALVYKAENFKIGELSEVAEYWNVNYENTPYGGWNTSTNAYIVYKFDKQIEDFEIIFYNYLFDNNPSPLHEIKLFVSADDTTYTEVNVSTENLGNSNSYVQNIPKHVLTPSGDIPEGSYYLKLTSTALTDWSTNAGKLVKVSVATGEQTDPGPTEPESGLTPGGNVLALTPDSDGSWDGHKIFKTIDPFVVGETYKIKFYAKSDPTGAKVGIFLGATGHLLSVYQTENLPGDWQSYEYSFTADAVQETLRLFAQCDEWNNGKKIYVDCIEIIGPDDSSSFVVSEFENGLAGWTEENTTGYISVVQDPAEQTEPPAENNHVLQYGNIDNNWNKSVFQDIHLLPGTYTINADVIGFGNGIGAAVRFKPYDISWAEPVPDRSTRAVSTDSWVSIPPYTFTISEEGDYPFVIGGEDAYGHQGGTGVWIDNVSVTDASGTEYVKNGDFEDGLNNWNFATNSDSHFSVVSTLEGHAIKVEPGDKLFFWDLINKNDVPGSYTVSFKAKGDAVVQASLRDGNDWGDWGTNKELGLQGDDWQTISFSVDIETLNGNACLLFEKFTSGVLYIDDIVVKKGTETVLTLDAEGAINWHRDSSDIISIVPSAEADAWKRSSTPGGGDDDFDEGYTHSNSTWAMVHMPGDYAHWTGVYQRVNLEENKTYKLGAWFSGSGPIALMFQRGTNGTYWDTPGLPQADKDLAAVKLIFDGDTAISTTLGEWVYKEMEISLPAGWSDVWWAGLFDYGPGGPMYIDDVELYEYVDGVKQGANLIDNGGFESGGTSWQEYNTGSIKEAPSKNKKGFFIRPFRQPKLGAAFIDHINSVEGTPYLTRSETGIAQNGDTGIQNNVLGQGATGALFRRTDETEYPSKYWGPNSTGYITYETSYDIHEYMIQMHYWSDFAYNDLKVTFATSASGPWEEPEVSSSVALGSLNPSHSEYPRVMYEGSTTVDGYKFMRIEWPGLVSNGQPGWGQHISMVAVNAYCSPVVSSVETFTVIPATGLDVSLSSPETALGGEIWYSRNSATAIKYDGNPLNLISVTKIEAWTIDPAGLKNDSIHVTFIYPGQENITISEYGFYIHEHTNNKAKPEHPQTPHSDDDLKYVVPPAESHSSDPVPPTWPAMTKYVGVTKEDYWAGMLETYEALLSNASSATSDLARDKWGGLVGSKETLELDETGFFHIEYKPISEDPSDPENENTVLKALLVDPLGNLFFSLGVCGIGSTGDTMTKVQGREYIYRWLPTAEEIAATTYAPAFLNNQWTVFSHYIANRVRNLANAPTDLTNKANGGYLEKNIATANNDGAFNNFNGPDFFIEGMERLKKWGFNTAAGFSSYGSDQDFARVDFMGSWGGSLSNDNKIYDVFNQANFNAVKADAKAKAISEQNNTKIIGFMTANEVPYNNIAKTIAEIDGSGSAAGSASKKKMVELFLEWNGGIAGFNSAWGLSLTENTMLTSNLGNMSSTDKSRDDMDRFLYEYARQYYRAYREGWDEGNGKQMLIGDRWLVSIMSDDLARILAKAGGEYLDAITYNYYTEVVSEEKLQNIYNSSKIGRAKRDGIAGYKDEDQYPNNDGKNEALANVGGLPIIVTEFHYGDSSTDQGFGIRPAEDTREKGVKYSAYIQALARSGVVVGAHWFEYIDESATSRWFDGENGAIGLINTADMPYVDFFGPDEPDEIKTADLEEPGAVYTNYNIYKYILNEYEPITPPGTENEDHLYQRESEFVKVPQGVTHVITATEEVDAAFYTSPPLLITTKDCVSGTGMVGYGAVVNAAWDDANLYLHVKVDDPSPGANNHAGDGIWQGDGLEIFFSADMEKVSGFTATETQLLINGNPEKIKDGGVDYYWQGRNSSTQPAFERKLTLLSDGYVVELAIPWELVGNLTPADGERIRFDIGFDNANRNEYLEMGSRDRQYLWTGYDRNSSDLLNWGFITLVAEP
ncbi:MAG: carbohydrate binding domain-containing protein, partial [Clostridiales bacterium]|nr:carbohydrate binding domain-containing protein [Clostridiales bacterium]